MRTPLLLDGRNLFDPEEARAAGFVYIGVGRARELAELGPRILSEEPSQSQEALTSARHGT